MLFAILLTLKTALFIYLTRVEYNHILIFTVSLLYILFFFTLIYLSKNKKKHTLAFTFYNIISAIMFADAMYYYYFNALPSIAMVKQLKVVGAIGDSVKDIISPLNILFLIDIPFLMIYSKWKKKMARERKIYPKKWRVGIPSAILAIIVIFNIVLNSFGYSEILGKQELFTYHGKDIIEQFKSQEEMASGESMLDKEDIEYLRKRSTTENGKHTGIGKGKNLIVLQVEALQNFVVNMKYDGQEITPNINKFINNNSSIYFDRYYQLVGKGSTSDAEFVTNNSLYPSMEDPTYEQFGDNTFYGLPKILKDEGYRSWSFHGYKPEFWSRDKVHPKQGFERFISEKDYKVGETVGFGLRDEDFFEQTIPYLKEMGEPFHAFIITLTSHTPFNMPEKYHEIDLRPEHVDTMFGNYLQAIHYTDKALGQFFENLKKEGLYDNTVIAMYGDHFALSSLDDENKEVMTDYLGYEYDFDDMMNIPLVVHVPGEDIKETVSTVGSQMDFLPTILNIMGIKNEKGIMFGVDMLNSTEGIVAQQIHMWKGSFFDQEKMFVMSRDGIFDHSRAKDLKTKKPIDVNQCRETYEKVISEIDKSNFILRNDIIKDLLEGNNKFSVKDRADEKNIDIENKEYIALSGGEVKGIPSTNSLEALNESYKKGFRLIQVDLQWTTDEKLVLLHDWDETVSQLFSVSPKKYSYEEFKNFKMVEGLHQMTFEDLKKWMDEHSAAHIVLNIQEDTVKALRTIRETYPGIQENIIPEISDMQDYYPANAVDNYRNIILNISSKDYSDKEVIDFIKTYKHFGIAMSLDRARGELPKKLEDEEVPTYVYTIDDKREKTEIIKNNVFGIYTNRLEP